MLSSLQIWLLVVSVLTAVICAGVLASSVATFVQRQKQKVSIPPQQKSCHPSCLPGLAVVASLLGVVVTSCTAVIVTTMNPVVCEAMLAVHIAAYHACNWCLYVFLFSKARVPAVDRKWTPLVKFSFVVIVLYGAAVVASPFVAEVSFVRVSEVSFSCEVVINKLFFEINLVWDLVISLLQLYLFMQPLRAHMNSSRVVASNVQLETVLRRNAYAAAVAVVSTSLFYVSGVSFDLPALVLEVVASVDTAINLSCMWFVTSNTKSPEPRKSSAKNVLSLPLLRKSGENEAPIASIQNVAKI